jgi:hypothetical protein
MTKDKQCKAIDLLIQGLGLLEVARELNVTVTQIKGIK